MLGILIRSSYTFLFLNIVSVIFGTEEASRVSHPHDLVIPSVQTQFNKIRFLDLYNQHNPDHPLDVDISTVPANLKEKTLAYKCWEALFALKEKYQKQKDFENYKYVYLDMANLFLAYGIFPQPYENKDSRSDYKNFQMSLLGSIKVKVSQEHDRQDKLLKWSHISHAKLCMDYVRRYPSTKHRLSLLKSAYRALNDATELKTTQTSYLLLAKLILDYQYTPEGITKAQAVQKAKDALMQVGQKNEGAKTGSRKGSKPKEREFFVISYAKPTYLRDLPQSAKVQLSKLPFISQSQNSNDTKDELDLSLDVSIDGSVRGENSALENSNFDTEVSTSQEAAHGLESVGVGIVGTIEDDLLKDFDYRGLMIPTINFSEELPVRRKILNPVIENITDRFLIDGKIFKRSNVSGRGMRCLFNALGLDPVEQIAKLKEQAQNPTFRYMIANEIVSAARTPDQIPLQVKKAINYLLYEAQSHNIDLAERQRTHLLAQQNRDANLTDLSLLPGNLRNLNAKQEDILGELRQRALSLEAFSAFLNYHIGNEEMMVALHDLRDQQLENCTSIDAICLNNNIGVKIYQLNHSGALQLVHQFIPENAVEVAYLYHNALHFQALFPIDEKEITSSSGTESAVEDDASDSHSYDMDVESLTSKDRQFIKELEAILRKNECDLGDLHPDLDSDFIHLVDKHFGEESTLVIHIYDMFGNEENTLRLDSDTPNSSIYHLHVKDENEKLTWFLSQRQTSAQANKTISSNDSIPDVETLRTMYPSVAPVEKKDYDEDFIRKVLYCSEHLKMHNNPISKLDWVNLDQRRISEILIANNLRQKKALSPEAAEAIVESYHDFYDAIQAGEVIVSDIIRALAKKLDLDQHYVLKRYMPLLTQGKKEEPQDDKDERTQQVVKLYLKGKKFSNIQQDTKFTYQSIVKIISKHVEKGKRRHYQELSVPKKAFTESEVKEIIINKFNDLKTQNKGKPVAILHVSNALKDQKIGYKTVERILKGNNLVQTQIKAKHLDTEQIEAIKADWEKMRKTLKLGDKQQAYKTIAQKRKVTEQQVKSILKNYSYKSDRVHLLSNMRQLIIDAYNDLSSEQKVRPASHIKKKLDSYKLNSHLIHNVLEAAGHYKWNGEHGKAAKNLAALKEVEISKSRKRTRIDDEADPNSRETKKSST